MKKLARKIRWLSEEPEFELVAKLSLADAKTGTTHADPLGNEGQNGVWL